MALTPHTLTHSLAHYLLTLSLSLTLTLTLTHTLSMSTREEVVRANIAFMYGRDEEAARHDPDKRAFVRSKRVSEWGSDAVMGFTGEWAALAADYASEVVLAG